ncbi:hypothetical protein [Desertihabitans aurantiacus]|uniref:hypothetical protein n=1 Tax=Desertihabitans aurantiacus TaxID=2282477 RepID=UPI000DF7CDB2|nr:hypothetical protein [Desertihabitans aurantiacus]
MQVIVHGWSGHGGVPGLAGDHPSALLELVARGGPGPVLVLTPQHLEVIAREQASVLVAAQPGRGVCVLALPHHALTLAVVASGVAHRVVGSDPGRVVQEVLQVTAHSRSLLWHPRLAGLAEPRPGLGQVLAAAWPGRGYLATVGVPTLVPDRAGLGHTSGEQWFCPAQVPQRLREVLLPTGVRAVEGHAVGRAPYATAASVELAGIVPVHTAVVPGPPCRSCGAGLVGPRCAFCNQGPPRLAAAPAGAPPTSPTTPVRVDETDPAGRRSGTSPEPPNEPEKVGAS